MRAPYRIIRNVPVEIARGKLETIDVVPLADADVLRRKANAWDYAVRRGFLTSTKIAASIDFAKLGDVETLDVKPDDVVLFRTPDIGVEQIEDLRRSLAEVFPDNRVVVLMGDTGGAEVASEAKARKLPGVARALDSLEESSE